MVKDYYEILNLSQNAKSEDIKKSYRKAAMYWHPDKNPSSNAREKFIEINEAYEILSSPEKKIVYDGYYRVYFSQEYYTTNEEKKSVEQEENLGKWVEEIRTKWNSKKTFKVVDDSFVNIFHLMDKYQVILLILFFLLILYLKNN